MIAVSSGSFSFVGGMGPVPLLTRTAAWGQEPWHAVLERFGTVGGLVLCWPLLRLRLPSELLLTQWDSCATRTPAQYLRCVARIAKDDLAHALLRKGD